MTWTRSLGDKVCIYISIDTTSLPPFLHSSLPPSLLTIINIINTIKDMAREREVSQLCSICDGLYSIPTYSSDAGTPEGSKELACVVEHLERCVLLPLEELHMRMQMRLESLQEAWAIQHDLGRVIVDNSTLYSYTFIFIYAFIGAAINSHGGCEGRRTDSRARGFARR